MKYFFTELQNRGVIRVGGLYGALIWFLLQVADVVFPAFGIPDSIIGILLVGSLILLPFVLAFAWFFEVTDQGIQTEEEARSGSANRLLMGSEVYFIIIALLAIALSISVYMNIMEGGGEATEKEPLSVLIADVQNQTGDSIYNGTVEQMLTIGMEGADFISAYDRVDASRIAEKLVESDQLSEESARLVAVREGIDMVLSGSITRDQKAFLLNGKLLEPREGATLADIETRADNRTEVLSAIALLADLTRESLGDVSVGETSLADNESISARSLEAVGFYSVAQRLSRSGEDEEAVGYYSKAIEEDAGFGRAYSGLALSLFKMGETDKSRQYWDKALSLVNTMTSRERYRTQGLYYSRITQNYHKAIETYEKLVTEFPSDWIAHNNLAVVYFLNRDLKAAREQGQKPLDMFPSNPVYRTNYALYAMYAGDFLGAAEEGKRVLEVDASYFKAYLPIGMHHLIADEKDEAIATYRRMAEIPNGFAKSLSLIAQLDLSMYFSDADYSKKLISDHGSDSGTSMNPLHNAVFQTYIATYYSSQGQPGKASDILDQLSSETSNASRLIAMALVYLQLGNESQIMRIIEDLGGRLQAEPRAYADLLRGMMYLKEANHGAAMDQLLASLDRTDTWMGHLVLGKAYLAAGFTVEALSEFEICQARLGEASALFLDDIPSIHYARELSYYLARTQENLGQKDEAIANYEAFLLRSNKSKPSVLALDSSTRLARLTAKSSPSE